MTAEDVSEALMGVGRGRGGGGWRLSRESIGLVDGFRDDRSRSLAMVGIGQSAIMMRLIYAGVSHQSQLSPGGKNFIVPMRGPGKGKSMYSVMNEEVALHKSIAVTAKPCNSRRHGLTMHGRWSAYSNS